MVHHSLTKDGATVSWKAIEEYHKVTNGWEDIGYHAGVELINDKYYALMGRDLSKRAAAVKEEDMNGRAFHVCLVGDFDLMPPTKEQLNVLIQRVIHPWMYQFGIRSQNVRGHRDFAPYKSCPGKLFDMDQLRGML